jgi:hypothetical protein
VEALGEASSHAFEKAGGGSFGGTELAHADSRRANVAGLLIDVLTRLGGASQVDQQPALVSKTLQSATDFRRAFSCSAEFSFMRCFLVPPTLLDQFGELFRQYSTAAFRQHPKMLLHAAVERDVD